MNSLYSLVSINTHILSENYKLSEFLGFDQNIGIGNAVQNNLVTFEIEVTFQNGTTKIIQYQDMTDSTGKAEYIMPADQTVNIIHVQSIGISLSNQDFSSFGRFTLEIGNKIIIKIRENQDDIIMVLIGIIIFLLTLITVLFFYRRRKKGKRSQQKEIDKVLTPSIKHSVATIEKIQAEIASEEKIEDLKDKEEELLAEEFKEESKESLPIEEVDESNRALFDSMDIEMREFREEIVYILNLVMARSGKNQGKMTLNFLKKTLPERFSEEKMVNIFNNLPSRTQLFKKKGVSLIITPVGKRISKEL
jgi:LPXTG-motif cell wall-anchored protein